MIKLALAVGFLAVFGLAAYAIVVHLSKQFNEIKKQEKENESK